LSHIGGHQKSFHEDDFRLITALVPDKVVAMMLLN
jgi:hypothetical protein